LLEPAGATDAFETIEAADVTDANDGRADFDARFALARQRLLGIAGSLVGAQEADDVVHDSYLLARERFDQLRDPSAFEGWLTRIVVNQCFRRHRRTRRLRELLPTLVPRRAAGSDMGLRDLVERLPARERTVLVLHYGHGYGLEEIASMLDLTHTNVRTIIARTRKRLFRAWREAECLDR
jgi:RNA polymerase sigma factor (sigma-70 family)